MFNFEINYEELIWGDKFKNISKIKYLKIDDAFNYISKNFSQLPIISHNGDYPVDERYEKYIDNFPVWYGQNVTAKHIKFIPIPIGLENDYVTNSVEKKHMLVRTSNHHICTKSSKLMYVNHNIGTNQSQRQEPYIIFFTNDWATVEHGGGFTYQQSYYSKILQHDFTLSPPGNGVDCHRTWEILYLRRIPILKRIGKMEELYADLPVLFIDQYEEICRDFLQEKLEEIKSRKFNFEKLKFNYWKSLVLSNDNV